MGSFSPERAGNLPAHDAAHRPCHRARDDACHGRFLRDGTTWPGRPGGGIESAGGSTAGEAGQTKPKQGNYMSQHETGYGASGSDGGGSQYSQYSQYSGYSGYGSDG